MEVNAFSFDSGIDLAFESRIRPVENSGCVSMSSLEQIATTSSSSKAIISRIDTGLAYLLRVLNNRLERCIPASSVLWLTKITGICSSL